DETTLVLETFIIGLENLLSLKVKIIKYDNGTEFKNSDLNQFCGLKGIKREFSVPRTPQQNGIAERKNKTLIDAARTLLADLLLRIPFWAEALSTACYVQNRVLVTKPHNKTPYELLHGRLPSIGFMRPFGFPITILNTLDPLGKFQGKVDEGYLVGYSVCSKAFKVFNSRTRIVQETLHVNFMENKPTIAGFGPAWLSSSSGAQTRKQGDKTENKDKGKSPVVTIIGVRDLNTEFEECNNNRSNGINAASSSVSTVGHNFINNTNDFSAAGPSNAAMLNVEDLTHSNHADDVGAEADINNMESIISVSPIPTTRIHKDHPTSHIIGDLSLTTQTRSMARAGNPQQALKDKGVIDSGCSRHMTGNMSYLSNFKELNGGYVAFGGNPKGGKITCNGKIKTGELDFDDVYFVKEVDFDDVYFVKELKFNLFSVSRMCDKKNNVLFTDSECLVLSSDFKLPDASQVLLRVPRENN
nr:ribonuclease H-like domain-containing protein [Tanacetum cinerariifolium]